MLEDAGPPPSTRLARAVALYGEFYASCFWHSPRELVITEEFIPFVIAGLRKHGGRRGFLLAETFRAVKERSGERGQKSRKMPR